METKSNRGTTAGISSRLEVPDSERPAPSSSNALYGSDLIAQTLRDLDVGYIAINPGASYRGLHDSLVNHLGNSDPQMLVCLHEGHAVAIAHGYAKVTGKAMAVGLHSNVGLMHGTMGMFNAWCDRMPMMVLGATGPVDAAKRRPWIDWIHTARDQGALVRGYVKWDDQPASPAAAREAMVRANWITNASPQAPVYLNFDSDMQESQVSEDLPSLDIQRYQPPQQSGLSGKALSDFIAMLKEARSPVFLMGRVTRKMADWRNRIVLAEMIGAKVISDGKLGVGFPTDHPLHIGYENGKVGRAALQGADLIVSLDWIDLAGCLSAAGLGTSPEARIVQISMDQQLHNGWSMDHQALPPVDLLIATHPDVAVAALVEILAPDATPNPYEAVAGRPLHPDDQVITVPKLAQALKAALADQPHSLCRTPSGWSYFDWPLTDPLDYFGSIGGAGLGGSAGIAIGCALGLRQIGSDRLTVGVFGDGDFLMGATALWTAVHYKLPMIYVIANNCSYFGDEVHQQKVAEMRNRNVENKSVGLQLTDPDVDIAMLARSQGAVGIGPVRTDTDLTEAFRQAVEAAKAGAVVLVDVRTAP